jgi:hypothetical protein
MRFVVTVSFATVFAGASARRATLSNQPGEQRSIGRATRQPDEIVEAGIDASSTAKLRRFTMKPCERSSWIVGRMFRDETMFRSGTRADRSVSISRGDRAARDLPLGVD